MPMPRRRLSVQLRSGTWQLPQALVPLPDRRGSKNRCVPSAMASGFPETRLVGSFGTGAGHGPWDRMILISLSVNATLSSAEPTPAARLAVSLVAAACAAHPGVGSADESVAFTYSEIKIILSQ